MFPVHSCHHDHYRFDAQYRAVCQPVLTPHLFGFQHIDVLRGVPRVQRSVVHLIPRSVSGWGPAGTYSRRHSSVSTLDSNKSSAAARYSASAATAGRSRRARRQREPNFASGPLASPAPVAGVASDAASASAGGASSTGGSGFSSGVAAASSALYLSAKTAATRSRVSRSAKSASRPFVSSAYFASILALRAWSCPLIRLMS